MTNEITKQTLTKIEERFGVFFGYDAKDLEIVVYRLGWDKKSKSDEMTAILLDELITEEEFEDYCVCWCDENAA